MADKSEYVIDSNKDKSKRRTGRQVAGIHRQKQVDNAIINKTCTQTETRGCRESGWRVRTYKMSAKLEKVKETDRHTRRETSIDTKLHREEQKVEVEDASVRNREIILAYRRIVQSLSSDVLNTC